jgi:hypothetical protein
VRTRDAFLAVVLVLAATGCSGDGDGDAEPNPTDPVSEITVDCEEYDDAAKAITSAQAELYADSGSEGAIDRLAGELAALKDDAPPQIQTALTDMEAGFRDAKEFLANPTPENKANLVDLAPELTADGQRITAYIRSECE